MRFLPDDKPKFKPVKSGFKDTTSSVRLIKPHEPSIPKVKEQEFILCRVFPVTVLDSFDWLYLPTIKSFNEMLEDAIRDIIQ